MTRANFRALDHLSGGVAAHPEEADELREQLQQLESQIAAVRAIHTRWDETYSRNPRSFCEECETEWPCKTITALGAGES